MSLDYRLSRGVPRVINIICDRALLGAYAQNERRIGAAIVKKASREASGCIPFCRRIPLVWITVLLLLTVLAFGGVAFFNPKVRSALGWNERTAAKESSTMRSSERLSSAGENGAAASGSGNKILKKMTLADVLAKSPVSDASVFADLYELWGVRVSLHSSNLGCKAGAAEGFECLSQAGGWPKLRRYNLPAMLDLLLPNGLHRRVVLGGLKDESAMLIIEGRRDEFSILEIDRLWDGSFILLWKPPFSVQKLSNGAQGEPVRWVQHALDRLEGLPSNSPVSGVYDDSLEKRVKAFQRKKSLKPDGRIGSETLVQLVLALEGPHVPMLSPRGQ
jgi:general secretion pathway protein A